MKHAPTIAMRELRSMFVSPVAYAVLSLFAALSGLFFVLSVAAYNMRTVQLRQFQAFEQLEISRRPSRRCRRRPTTRNGRP